MNKKTIYIVVGVIVLALLAYFFLFNKKSSAPSNTSVQGTEQSAGAPAAVENNTAGAQSLKDLIAAGKSVKCTYSEGINSGTIYVADGKARAEFTSAGQKGHMFMMDNTSYIWMNGSTQGFKTSMSQSTQTTPPGSPTSQGVDSGRKMNYSCSPWTVEAGDFTLPASVQFMDAASMMKVPGQK